MDFNMFTNMFLQYHVSTWLTEMCQKLTRPGHVTPGRADWWAQEDPMAFWPALSKPSPVLGHALETPSDLATKRSKEVFRTNLDFANFRKNNLKNPQVKAQGLLYHLMQMEDKCCCWRNIELQGRDSDSWSLWK